MTTTPPPCTCTCTGDDLELVADRSVGADFHDVATATLTSRRVLVTGAGGSIGSELCAQIAQFGPAELIALDRDESALQQTQVAVSGHGLLDTREVVLADVRDADAVHEVFLERRPEIVFHAAALKHLPMLEQYPDEAWKTNVLGTLNVLRAAEAAGVDRLVNVSTDKAANPTSVLGMSKRLAERLTSGTGHRLGRAYSSVRFGNVIGSRGSMVPLFRALIRNGGPVTVTHPDATRYFMSIAEACRLLVQASAYERPGEVLVLDMGEPVRVLDVAERLIRASGRDDVEITFTGLRDGEKLHEELIGVDEEPHRRFHPLITQSTVPPIAPDDLAAAWHAMRSAVRSSTAPTTAAPCAA